TPVDSAHTPGNATNAFIITQPGSYYLTGNVAVASGSAIVIATNDVTLDLNGFTISSTASPAAGTANLLGSGLQDSANPNRHIKGNVTYSAGTYSGAGFLNGISYLSTNSPVNARVSGISISGCSQLGINLGREYSSLVERCHLRTIGSDGITAGQVSQCVVYY